MNPNLKKRIESINKGIIPEGYKKTKVGIVPVEWENMKFSDIFTEKSIRTSDFEKYPLYSLTIEEGVVPKSERYERSHLVKKDDVFKIVSENDYVYNPMNVRFGALARYKGKNPVSVSGYYDVFYVNDNYSMEYMDNFLLSAPMINYYNVVSTGSLKEKQRVHFSQFIEFNLPIPPLPEQQKIAEILSTQDKLIELQERKINQLKTLKKGYLQKMFPKKGCKYPELRFKGFTDPWEQRELGSVFTQTSYYVNPKEDNIELWSLTVEEGLVPKTERYTRDFLVKKEDKFKEVRTGDIVYNPMNMTLGAIGYNNMAKSIAVSGYYVTMVANNNTDPYFINTWLKSPQAIFTYKNYATGSLKEKQRIQFPTLSAISVPFPELEEQQQIGTYFRNLDNIITLHQRKLDEEKQKKKALMQLLLTGKVRVKL